MSPCPPIPPYIHPHTPLGPPPPPPCPSVCLQVFLTEYAGPLLIYLLFYFRVPFLYGPRYDFTASRHAVVQCVGGVPRGSQRGWGGDKGVLWVMEGVKGVLEGGVGV